LAFFLGRASPIFLNLPFHSRRFLLHRDSRQPVRRKEAGMNEARRKQIQQALALIEQAKGLLEVVLAQEQEDFDNISEDLQSEAEDTIDALERAATCCDDVMTACEEAI
jgi:hypothetical protein